MVKSTDFEDVALDTCITAAAGEVDEAILEPQTDPTPSRIASAGCTQSYVFLQLCPSFIDLRSALPALAAVAPILLLRVNLNSLHHQQTPFRTMPALAVITASRNLRIAADLSAPFGAFSTITWASAFAAFRTRASWSASGLLRRWSELCSLEDNHPGSPQMLPTYGASMGAA